MIQKRRTASPAPTGLAVQKSNCLPAADTPSLPANPVPVDEQRAMTGVGVVVTVGPGPDGQPRFRRKLYLTTSAAYRAVQDARDRGQQAEAVLVELRPLTAGGGVP